MNKYVHKVKYLMRNPANEKGSHYCCEHFQNFVISGLVFLDLVGTQQGLANQTVAGDNDHKRNEKTQNAFHEAHPNQKSIQVGILV